MSASLGSETLDAIREASMEPAVEVHDGQGMGFGIRAESFEVRHRHAGGAAAKPVPTPEQLSGWLERTEAAAGESTRQALWKFLHRLNQSAAPSAAQRLELLEILRPAVMRLLAQPGHKVAGEQGFPLASGPYLSALCGIRLASALGQAYWLVVNSPEFSGEDALLGIPGGLTIRRALEIHGLAMLLAFETYAPLPAGFWRRVYGMYVRAELRGWVERDCWPCEPGDLHATIAGAFKHLCLFAVASPHRYRPDEIRAAYRFVAQHAARADLLSVSAEELPRTPFLIDLFSDTAPSTLELRAAPFHSGVRLLQTFSLVAEAHGLEGSPARELHEPLRRANIRSLVKALDTPPARRACRFGAEGQLGLVLGLGHIQNTLAEVDEREFVEYRGVKWLRIPDLALEEVESIELVEKTGFTDFGRSAVEASRFPSRYSGVVSREAIWQRNMASDDASGMYARLVNSSSTGYGLKISPHRTACLKVGALIGLRNQAGSFHLGVVRWLRYDEAGNLGFGVELLMPATLPVRMLVPGENRRALTPALFYPGNSPLERDARLVVAPGTLRPNQVVVLESLSGQPAFRVERLLESSPEFQQFSIGALS
jgi:hypothetical protein